MIAQVRMYTINKDMMDSQIECWRDQLLPILKEVGIPVVGAWVNRAQNEFIWIRMFKDEADMEAKNKTYQEHPARKALGGYPGTHHAKLEIRNCEVVWEAVPTDL